MILLHLHFVLYPIYFSIPLSIYQPLLPVDEFQNKSKIWYFTLNYFSTPLPEQNCLNRPFSSSRRTHVMHVIFISVDITQILSFTENMLWSHGDTTCVIIYLVWSPSCPIWFNHQLEVALSNHIILWDTEESWKLVLQESSKVCLHFQSFFLGLIHRQRKQFSRCLNVEGWLYDPRATLFLLFTPYVTLNTHVSFSGHVYV